MRPTRLLELEQAVELCRDALAEAERARDEFIVQHCKENPLSETLISAMADRMRAGGALCCKDGLAWLRERVDAVWTPILNHWAYEALGCHEDRPEKLQEWGELVLKRLHDPDFVKKQMRND